ncbi:MAG: hypothetical protein ACOZFS_04235 [Thermodesulfobacteriota bacterium]
MLLSSLIGLLWAILLIRYV